MQSLQVRPLVKRESLWESVLFRGLYKPVSTFCHGTCNRFNFLHVVSVILLVSYTSNFISIILADS